MTITAASSSTIGPTSTSPPSRWSASICRRQGTGEIEVIVHSLASIGLRLHGFGVEAGGLVRYADCLVGGFAGLELRGTTDATVARLPSLQLRELPTVCGGVAGAHARSG